MTRLILWELKVIDPFLISGSIKLMQQHHHYNYYSHIETVKCCIHFIGFTKKVTKPTNYVLDSGF